MHTYAPRFLLRKGLADRWTALEQMWVAERAHRSGRGYGPWPNTARSCGLPSLSSFSTRPEAGRGSA